MIDTVATIRASVGAKILVLRSYQRLLSTEQFAIAYDASNPSDKLALNSILKSNDKTKLKTWINQLVRGRLNYMSFRKLRDWAKEENVPYWSRLSKEELIEALEKITDAKRLRDSQTTSRSNGLHSDSGGNSTHDADG